MIEAIAVAAAQYIVLQTPDGRTVHVNPEHIVGIGQTKGKLVTDTVQCIIYTTDGRFFTVVETCDSIRKRLDRRE